MNKILIFVFSLIFMLSPILKGQNKNAEIIKKALHDELVRGMDSIAKGSPEKPCFMSFTVIDGEVFFSAATLGAIISSNAAPTLSYSSRFIVGDYHMNDENFNFQENPDFKFNQEIKMPRKVDYWGIRRALWTSTEKMYENASKSYRAKKAFLEDNDLTKEDYVLPDFSKAPVVKMHIPSDKITFDKAYWDDITRKVSKVFGEYPEVINSNATFSFIKATSHFLNNEGSEYTYPTSLVNFDIYAAINDTNNVSLEKTISITGSKVEDIPSLDSLKKVCHYLVKQLKDEKTRKSLQEAYSGPILFEEEAASSLLLNTLFSYDGLVAKREPLNYRGYDFRMPTKPESNSIEAKMNKPVVDKGITVKSLSHLKDYNGTKLLGSFEIDGEGVVPPKELTLIENGVLKTLLNDRVPTFTVKESNGHNRINGLWGNSISPGVLQITTTESTPKKQLKKELINMAKENGNDYCFIVRTNPVTKEQMIFQVDINDGNEKQVTASRIGFLKLSDLKKKVIFSDQEKAYNHLQGSLYTSVISPDAVIIKEMDISPTRAGRKMKASVVKNPIGEL